MKTIIFVYFLALITAGSSCFSGNNGNEATNNEEEEFTGTYDSKTGVMNSISCYCFEVGYFTNKKGEEFPICFDEYGEEPDCTENLYIKGYFEDITIEPENTSPCPAGTMEIFIVTEYECK